MALFHRHPDAVLISVSWERSIDMEQQEWVTKKSQARPLPGDDVRNVRREQEGYWETVTEWQSQTAPDGTITQQSVPRQEYRIRMAWTWEQLEWRKGRTVEASGTSQGDVHWPLYRLADRERVGNRHEEYVAVFETSRDSGKDGSGKHGKTHKGKLDEATWCSLKIGALYRIELGLLGGVKSVLPAEPS